MYICGCRLRVERGLKSKEGALAPIPYLMSLARRAWIEILDMSNVSASVMMSLARRAWIEILAQIEL